MKKILQKCIFDGQDRTKCDEKVGGIRDRWPLSSVYQRER